ncbi:MAG: tetratricopeptide repeat protein [Vampirovibrionia bacterium]
MTLKSSTDRTKKSSKKTSTDYYNKGLMHYHEGEIDQAIECFKKMIEINPADPKSHYTLAWAYHEIKNDQKALEHINIANDLNNQLENSN